MDLTAAVHRYLTTALASSFYGQAVEMLNHWEGEDNLLWRVACHGQEAVLKLFLDAGQARSRRQHDGQQLFAPLGVAPQPLWIDRYPEGLPRQLLVYTWTPGAPLDPRDPSQLAALAVAVAQVHGSEPSDVRRLSPNPLNLDYLWRMVQGSVRQIQGWLEVQEVPALGEHFLRLAARAGAVVEDSLPLWRHTLPTPVHGDLKLENVVDSFGSAVLLDWEMFGLGDPALEIASFLQSSRQQIDPDGLATWLQIYLGAFAQPGLEARVAAYDCILPFRAVCYLLDGLRRWLDAPDAASHTPAQLDFLAATLQAALASSAHALALEPPNLDVAVQTLFDHLVLVGDKT